MSAQQQQAQASNNTKFGNGGVPVMPQSHVSQQRRSDGGSLDRSDATPAAQQHQNVRHIPIFVEGRDEPLVNKNLDTNTTSNINLSQQPQQKNPSQDDIPKSTSIFDKVKNFKQAAHQRSESPCRTIPINIQQTTNTPRQGFPPQQPHSQQPFSSPNQSQSPSQQQPQQQQQQRAPLSADENSILKIHNIQKDVLHLMEKVEHFTGCSRKDRNYLYLDEMLTQNLLKLDTIDTEGKDNIKQARREVIKCINTCISVLEAKADLGLQQQQQQHQQQQTNSAGTGNNYMQNFYGNKLNEHHDLSKNS